GGNPTVQLYTVAGRCVRVCGENPCAAAPQRSAAAGEGKVRWRGDIGRCRIRCGRRAGYLGVGTNALPNKCQSEKEPEEQHQAFGRAKWLTRSNGCRLPWQAFSGMGDSY